MTLPVLEFRNAQSWRDWLEANHATSPGGWLRFARKGSTLETLTAAEALQQALCYGWIDGQRNSESEAAWLHKYTPRGKRSIWSKVNREHALKLIESGLMRPSGLAEVERARADGRWEQAYDSPRNATVPADLQLAFDANPAAAAFFATLSSANRYAVLWRIQTARKSETRARRVASLVEMLARHETFH